MKLNFLDNPIPFWFSKILKYFGYDVWYYKLKFPRYFVYYNTDGKIIYSKLKPSNYWYPAVTWSMVIYKLR